MTEKNLILQKLDSITPFKIETSNLIKKLSNLSTLTDRLDIIKDFNFNSLDKYYDEVAKLNNNERDYYFENKEFLENHFFGSKLIGKNLIFPETIYKKFFEAEKESNEFKYNENLFLGEKHFRNHISSNEFQIKLNSKTNSLLKAELKSINKREEKANKLLAKNKIDLLKDYTKDKDFLWTFKDIKNSKGKITPAKEIIEAIELIRIKEDLYNKGKLTLKPVSWGTMITAIKDYIYLKPYLEDLLNKSKDTTNNISTFDNIFNEKNNLIPKVSIENVYNYFRILIDHPNRNGEFYLDREKLLIFIKSTFIDLQPIKQEFNIPFSKDKIDVRSVFKKFADHCYNLEYNKKNIKQKYFSIMNDSFIGFIERDYHKWHETNDKIPTKKW